MTQWTRYKMDCKIILKQYENARTIDVCQFWHHYSSISRENKIIGYTFQELKIYVPMPSRLTSKVKTVISDRFTVCAGRLDD